MNLKEEIVSAAEKAREEIPNYFGRIVRVEFEGDVPDGASKMLGGGSCVFVRHGNRLLGLTCAHVVDRPGKCYLVPPRLEQPNLRGAIPDKRMPFELTAADAGADLAVFDIEADDLAAGKTLYSLSESDWLTFEVLQSAIGALSFMCGAWGKETDYVKLNDKQCFVSTPLYFARGPIVKVDQHVIVSDFSEHEIEQLNTRGFPQLKDVKVAGGSRDLSGTSGSALWVYEKGKLCLAGTLRQPEDGIMANPRIEFTPVWVIRDWLASVL